MKACRLQTKRTTTLDLGPQASNDRSIEELRLQIVEIRELLIELLKHHGHEDAAMRSGQILLNLEKRITLEEAAKLFWGNSLAKDKANLRIHADILQSWATKAETGSLQPVHRGRCPGTSLRGSAGDPPRLR